MDDGDDDDIDDDDDTDDDYEDDDTDDDNDHKNDSYTAAGAAPGASVPCSFSRVPVERPGKSPERCGNAEIFLDRFSIDFLGQLAFNVAPTWLPKSTKIA